MSPPTYIIIVGLGGIGRSLIELAVEDKNDVVVIDEDEDKCREITKKYDVMTIVGDATERETLVEAGAEKAHALIATTSDDAANLMMCLEAKELGTKKVISVVNQKEHVDMFKKADISMLENPDMTIAKHLYTSAKNHRTVRGCFSVSGGKAEIIELKVGDKSQAVGKNLSKLNLKDGVIVAIERNNEVIFPKEDTVLQPGDLVTIFTKAKGIDKMTALFT
ncbi:MAG: potassium channel family protein [Candidatus Methanospirareceae archaeon]